jgi:hypothetical protein
MSLKGQETLFPLEKLWRQEWQGMPEFEQPQDREYAKIVIRFRNESDLQDFANLIAQKLNKKSQSTWHPELQKNLKNSLVYTDES